MRKVIIACDSYKGCMTSKEVNEVMAMCVRSAFADVVTLEMSDGGEGMLDAMLSAVGGERITVPAHDALMRSIVADYGMVTFTPEEFPMTSERSSKTAVIEIAQAAGLSLIEPCLRNPMKATSWGVGEIILHAYSHGARRFIIGLGGSATSDCGMGMLKAMGDDWKKIRQDCTFVLASDVTNPLCGPQGAAHVFAPQKGADAHMVDALDERARRFADMSACMFACDRRDAPGAGAAGGLGYAFLQYFDAQFYSGAELLLEAIHFDDLLSDADLVVTGEGHSDRQTLMGKLPQRILEHCQSVRKNQPASPSVWLVSGGVSDGQALLEAGFDRVVPVTPKDTPLAEAVKPEVAKENIRKALGRAAELLCL